MTPDKEYELFQTLGRIEGNTESNREDLIADRLENSKKFGNIFNTLKVHSSALAAGGVVTMIIYGLAIVWIRSTLI